MPAKYIYEPWKALVQDQRKAGARIAGDGKADGPGVYPKPMFDFAERRAICLEGMKKAYAVGLYGDDQRVIDGTWRALFPGCTEGPTEGQTFSDAMVENGDGNSTNRKGRVPKKLDAQIGDDGTVPEEGVEAAETGGESKGGDSSKTGKRRFKRPDMQGTLDMHVVKRTKK
jgi:cryptochrome